MDSKNLRLAVIVLLITTFSTAAVAQRGDMRFRQGLAYGHVNPDYDGRFTFTRVRFTGRGGGWDPLCVGARLLAHLS
jgi:hypothetical protein